MSLKRRTLLSLDVQGRVTGEIVIVTENVCDNVMRDSL